MEGGNQAEVHQRGLLLGPGCGGLAGDKPDTDLRLLPQTDRILSQALSFTQTTTELMDLFICYD